MTFDLSHFYSNTWHSLTDDERVEQSKILLKQLPDGWEFTGLETYSADTHVHSIACFEFHGAKFTLVPGAEDTVLGFDRTSISMVATVRKLYMQWHQLMVQYEDDVDAEAEIEEGINLLKALRTVTIQPFLCEVEATDNAGCKPFEDLLAPVTELGLQLPTPDEWEYACAGGVQALFRWGNDAPGMQSPVEVAFVEVDEDYLYDHPNKDELWPELEQSNGWDLHTKPNGFGLKFPYNPYDWELTAEKGIMRGGDGGGSICGGEGLFKNWMVLATSYEHDWRKSYEKYGFVCGAGVRRILRLTEM